MFVTQVIKQQDKLYRLRHTASKREGQDLDLMKQYLNCDTCIESDGRLYFCRAIQDVEHTEHHDNTLPIHVKT